MPAHTERTVGIVLHVMRRAVLILALGVALGLAVLFRPSGGAVAPSLPRPQEEGSAGAVSVGTGPAERTGGRELASREVPPAASAGAESDETLTLRVVDAGGNARAGIPVAVYQGHRRDGNLLWSGATGTDGRAEVHGFQLLRRASGEFGDRFAAVLSFPTPIPSAVVFRGEPPPSRPVTLLLPDTGRLAVEIADAAGDVLRCRASVRLTPERRSGDRPDLPLPRWFEDLEGTMAAGEGALSFPFVGLGVAFVPRVQLGDRSRSWTAATVFGPAAPGQTVRWRGPKA